MDMKLQTNHAHLTNGDAPVKVDVKNLSMYYGKFRALSNIDLVIREKQITAIIGPSGCGKSTLLRTFNRMNDLTPNTRTDGVVRLDGQDIYAPGVDVVEVRRRVGMVFQRPNPFPSMTIYDNVLAGVRLNNRRMPKSEADDIVERSLKHANLWNEVSARLRKPGGSLSGGQQQRLCIARAIAVEPQVLLMDEPASALDPISTSAIEDLVLQLKEDYTIVIVTHNMQQAARISEDTAFFNIAGTGTPGKLIEFNPTTKIFSLPETGMTEAYISGRFG